MIILLDLIAKSIYGSKRSPQVATVTTVSLSTTVTINGTTNQVTVTDHGGSSFTLSTPQDINTDSSPTFASMLISGLTASRLLASNGSKLLVSADLNSWITGTANRVTITDDGDGTVTLTLPQDIHSGASPTFAGLTIGTLGGYIKGSAGLLSASLTIPSTDITGLGTMATQNADGVAITGGTISAFKFTTSPGSGKYLSTGADGTVSATTPSFSATSVVINVKDYGAVGDGSTDDTTAIKNAITACGAGDTLYFPKGKYKVTDTLSLTTRINMYGDGQYSMIGMSGNKDLIHYNGTGTSFQRVFVRDLYLLSTSVTSLTSLLKFEQVHDVNVQDVYFSGADINLHLKACLRSTFINCQTETTGVDGFLAESKATYGLKSERSGTVSSNGNRFFNCSFRQLFLDYSAHITDTDSQGGFSWYGGAPEGLDPAGAYSFYVSGVYQPFVISGIHAETTGDIYITGSNNGAIRDTLGAGVGITIVNSSTIKVDNCLVTNFDVDIASSGEATNCRQGAGTWSIKSPNFYADFPTPPSGQSRGLGGRASSMKNIVAGNLETWSAGTVPDGFAIRNNSTTPGITTVIKTGTGEADTTKLFGSYAAKITYDSAMDTPQGIEFTVPADVLASLTAEAVTIRNSEYLWTLSGSGTTEYYLRTAASGDPGILEPKTVIINGTPRQEGTLGSLAANRWGYGDNDSLGYSTIYVRITPSAGAGDPDDEAIGFVKYVSYSTPITIGAYFNSPAANKCTGRIWVTEHYYGSGTPGIIGYSSSFTLNSDSWNKAIATFYIEPYVTTLKIGFGMGSETTGDILYVDGIEIMTGRCVSDRFNDNTW